METTTADTLRQLREDAWSETVRDTLRSLSTRKDAVGEVATQLMTSRVWLEKAPMTVDGLSGWIAAQVTTGWGSETADAMVRALDWQLNTFRGGRKVEVTFRLEPVERMPDADFRADAAEQAGFSPQALAVRPDAPHSMGDLNAYASHYFGRTFLADAVGAGRKVELHNGTAVEAIASLRARGFEDFQQLGTPKLHFQILLAHAPHQDELRYAIACDDGPDMFGNLEKLLRVASLPGEGGSPVRRIAPSRMSRYDHRPDEPTYRYERLKQNYLSSGAIPAQVTVGFKNALLGVLEVRANRMARLQTLQGALRASAEPLLLADAEAIQLRALDPSALLASGALGAWFDGVERTLADSGWAPTQSASQVKLRTVEGPDGFLDHSRLRYRDADGLEREILLTRNPYGEVSLAAARLFRDSGVTDCFVLGTAAALDPQATVGALHLPGSAASAAGENTVFVNHALDAGLDPRAVHVGSRVANVRSPVDEFEEDIEALRGAKYDLLEMELAGFARGFAGSETKVSALQIVSDVPGSGQTLHGFSSHSVNVALENAVDVLVRNFGVRALD